MLKKCYLPGYIIIMLSSVLFCNYSIGQQKNDTELVVPDIDKAGMDHGGIYTPLGALLCYPWEFKKNHFVGPSVVYYFNDKPSPYVQQYYNENEKNLVFELQKDGTVKYWFKTDYLESPDDTVILVDGSKTFSHSVMHSGNLKIKKIYINGNWESDFKDSTIRIDFGKNEFGLLPLNAKFKALSSSEMCLKEIYFTNSLYHGKRTKIKRISTFYFVH